MLLEANLVAMEHRGRLVWLDVMVPPGNEVRQASTVPLVLPVLVVRMAKMVSTVQRDFQVHEVLLVIVGCLVSKVTPGLVVSTVVMVVTAQKV